VKRRDHHKERVSSKVPLLEQVKQGLSTVERRMKCQKEEDEVPGKKVLEEGSGGEQSAERRKDLTCAWRIFLSRV